MDPISLRYLERLLAVAFGGLAIYLGYRLFLDMPAKTDSSGKVVLPGGTSIYMSRVGPGAFFALFGAAIIGLSISKGVTYSTPAPAAPPASGEAKVAATPPPATTQFSGMLGTAAEERGDPAFFRASLRPKFRVLNRLTTMLRPDLEAGQRADVENTVHQVKMLLLRDAWGPDWGSFDGFERWLATGDTGPAPPALAEPARLYRYGRP